MLAQGQAVHTRHFNVSDDTVNEIGNGAIFGFAAVAQNLQVIPGFLAVDLLRHREAAFLVEQVKQQATDTA